jgi:hypothetical protein
MGLYVKVTTIVRTLFVRFSHQNSVFFPCLPHPCTYPAYVRTFGRGTEENDEGGGGTSYDRNWR